MVRTFPDAMVDQTAVDALEHQMPNHKKDRHVLAAAVVAGADLVVTNNVRHFLPADLAQLRKRSITPDELLWDLLDSAPRIVLESLEVQAAHMRTPKTWTVPELLGLFAGLGHGHAQAPELAAAAARELGVEPAAPPRVS